MTDRRADNGGARPGAGRKPVPPDKRRGNHTITLPPDLVAVARRLGDGNVSAGVAVALTHFAADPAHAALQLWQHIPTGAWWAVLLDRGRPSHAAGPLDAATAAAIQAGEGVALRWEERAADDINETEERSDTSAYRCVWPAG